MNPALIELFAIFAIVLGGSILFTAGLVVLALGARMWSDATAAAHRARAHGHAADEAQATADVAQEAIDETKRRPRAEHIPPTDDELIAAVVASRNGHVDEYTTESNEGIEEQPPIPGGGMYR